MNNINNTNNNTNSQLYNCSECKKSIPSELVKKCSRCSIAIYCNQVCQKKHWPEHKIVCKSPNHGNIQTNAQNILKSNIINNSSIQIDTPIFQSIDNVKLREYYLKGIHKQNSYHIANTRVKILEGCDHLNPETSVVTIFGAQFFDNSFVEPLPELLEKCKKMILVDIDPITLEKLKNMLNSPKVTTIETDITGCHNRIRAILMEAKNENWNFEKTNANFYLLLEKITNEMTKMKCQLPESLKEAKNSDYVISSLVGSVLGPALKQDFFKTCLTLFPCKEGVHADKNQKTLIEQIKILEKINLCLAYNHIETLKECSNSSGAIYYADTISVKVNGKDMTLIDGNDFYKFIQNIEKVKPHSKISKWFWPSSDVIYTVFSSLFLSKK